MTNVLFDSGRHSSRYRKAAILIIAVQLLSACREGEAPRQWTERPSHRWIDVGRVPNALPGFSAVAQARSGIDAVNLLPDSLFLRNRHYVNGSGVATGDFDGDGLADLYIARLALPNLLYRNTGRWRFEDVTETAGVALANRFSTGATFLDIDNDGDLDLAVTTMGDGNVVLQNDGTGRFSERALHSDQPRGSTTIAAGDIDLDGDLDVYVGNYKRNTVKDLFPPHLLTFERIVRRDDNRYYVAEGFEDHYKVAVDGNRIMRFEYAEPDDLFLNAGDGSLESASFTDGQFLDEAGTPLDQNPTDWALTVRLQDFDGDGLLDIFVCNDFESPDRMWLNQGDGRFRAAAPLTLRKTSNATMSVDVSDVDRDGEADIFSADMLSRDYQRRQKQMASQPPVPAGVGDLARRPQETQNTLFHSRGDGTFAEVAYLAGVHASDWTWSSIFLDVDLDGYEDLLLTTGHRYDAMDSDTQFRVASARPGRNWRNLLLRFPDLDLKNIAFRNRGDMTFEEVADGWGIGTEEDVSHGMALADFDNDGDLDVVINRLNDPVLMLRNDAAAPRVAVRLRGTGNTQGIGAHIVLEGGPVRQSKDVVAGGQYLSGSDPIYAFAADEDALMRIRVRWPSGKVSVVDSVRANRIYEIFETGALVMDSVETPQPPPAFEQVSVPHDHHEEAFDDFARQPLLPRRYSQLGPALAWTDLDRDGDDDLLIGAGRGGVLSYLRNDNERFTRVDLGPTAADDLTGLVAAPWNENATRVLVGRANYEQSAPSQVLVYEVTGTRIRALTPLPFGDHVPGPLSLADVDGDNDLDLFVGGRLVPGRYPEPASSQLYRNDGSSWVSDAQWSAPFQGIGMVSGSVMADLDRDGDQDLVLALEWGSLRYFVNDGTGQFQDRTEQVGLAGFTGWWNGVTVGDFNQDGRLDLVAGNWGWNTKYGRPDGADHALRLYGGDFDDNGVLDVIQAHYETSMESYVPDRGLAHLSFAMPTLRRRIRSFEQFASSTLAQVLGPSLDRAKVWEATTLGSMVFLQTDDGFEGRTLPLAAQYSPAFGLVVADYDGDGHEDIFVSQNFFAVQAEMPRNDAGRGLWLRGDGTGSFEAVDGHTSGVKVYGEQRAAAAADYDGDGRLDLAVTQNGAPTILYRGAGKLQRRVRLVGPAGNANAVGATISLQRADGSTTTRAVTAGSGYWSQTGTWHLVPEDTELIHVTWTDGTTATTSVDVDTPTIVNY